MSVLIQKDQVSFISDQYAIADSIPAGIYTINYNSFTNEFYLVRQKDKFLMPKDLYPVKQKELQYVKHAVKNTDRNIGLLLNGVKGTGKTLFADQICNELECPILLVENMGKDINMELIKFISSSIKQDCIFFFDEFEKKFNKEEQQFLLSVIDGTHNTVNKKMFLFTCNSLNVDENLLGRLSRVAYTLNFGYINDMNEIREYFKSRLTDLTEEQIGFITDYAMSKKNRTIDTFSYIIKEVRLCGFEAFKEIGSEIMNLENIIIAAHAYTTKYDTYLPSNGDIINEIVKMSLTEWSRLCDSRFDRYKISENINKLSDEIDLEEDKEDDKIDKVKVNKLREKMSELQRKMRLLSEVDITTIYLRNTEETLAVGMLVADEESFKYDNRVFRITELQRTEGFVLFKAISLDEDECIFCRIEETKSMIPMALF